MEQKDENKNYCRDYWLMIEIEISSCCFAVELEAEKRQLEEEIATLKNEHQEALEKLEEEKQRELKELQENLLKEKEEEFNKSTRLFSAFLFTLLCTNSF